MSADRKKDFLLADERSLHCPRGLSLFAFALDIGKGPGSVHKLAAVSFAGAKSDLLAQPCEPEPFQFLAFLKQAQSFPQDFALRF